MPKTKLWGAHEVTLSPFSFQSLKLKWCLRGLADVSGKLLDIGCGAGGLTKAIKREKPDLAVYGIDKDRQSIKRARLEAGGVKFKLGDAYNLPFPKSFFDGVCMFDVLEHLENPKLALREVRKALKPGGTFHFFVPLEKQPTSLYWIFLHKLGWKIKKRQSGHLNLYSYKSLSSLLRKHKLKIKKFHFSNHIFFQVVDLVYYGVWDLFGIRPGSSVETYLAQGSNSVLRFFLGVIKNILIPIFWVESLFLQRVPGGGVSITAVKVK